jgi:putative flippase GtrA
MALTNIPTGALNKPVNLADIAPGWLRPLVAVLPRLSRYTLVSVAALSLDLTVFSAWTAASGQATIAAVVGYSCGMLLHYVLSAQFVFDASATRKSARRTLVEFAASGLVGLAMTAGVIAVATSGLGLPALIAKIIAVGSSFLTVFWLRSAIVFKPRDQSN